MNPSHYKAFISLSLRTPFRLCTKSHFASSSSSPQPSKSLIMTDYLITQHGFSLKTAEKVSSTRALIKYPENADSVLNFLMQTGFTKTHLQTMVECYPALLFSNLDKTIKPKIKLFQDLGFSYEDLTNIIASDPWVLARSVDQQLEPSLLVLKKVLGSNGNVCKVLKLSGWFLKHNLVKTMMPNIEFMLSVGIDNSQITKMVFNFPRFFVLRPDNIKEFVDRVDELGFDRRSKMFFYAIRTLGSMTKEKWEMKLDLFRSLGFSEDQISTMFKKVPVAFAVSDRKVKVVAEYLLGEGKCGISYLAQHPEMLIYSLEGRMKPRIQIFETLKERRLVSLSSGLSSMLRLTDTKFFERYVSPYETEVGILYTGKREPSSIKI